MIHARRTNRRTPDWNVRLPLLRQIASEALIREGQSMKHCVGDDFFSNACYEGHYTIWSMGCDRGKGRENLLTIEVQGNEKITEILGYENRLPTPNELNIVQQWARINRLHIA